MNKDQGKLKHFYRLSLEIDRKYQSDKSNRIAEEIKKYIKKQQFCGNNFYNFGCVCYSESEFSLSNYLKLQIFQIILKISWICNIFK